MSRPNVARALLVAWLGVALLLGGSLAVGVSWNRAFQVDEVEHLHAGYHLAAGRALYSDVWKIHPPALYWALAPITTVDDPIASYRAGRLLLLATLFGTVALSAAAAGRLSTPVGGALAASLLLVHTTFVERGIEVRADGPLALCVVAALVVELWRPRAGPARRHDLVSGALLGVGFLLTLKAVFPSFAFGLLWLARAVRERCPGRVVWPCLAWATPTTLAVAWMALDGRATAFFDTVILPAFDPLAGSEHRSPFGPAGWLIHEGARNLAFWAVALVGLVVGVTALVRAARQQDTDHHPGLAFPALLAWIVFLALWANPFPWPYVHVTVVPPLVILGGAVVGRFLDQRVGRAAAVAVAAGVWLLAALGAAPRLITKATPVDGYAGQAHQVAHLLEVDRVLGPHDPVFDLAGLYFRPDGYRAYALSGDLFGWYARGGLPPMVDELIERGNLAVIRNYRSAWLRPWEQRFVDEHYVHHFGNLYLHGRDLGALTPAETISFRVLAARDFRFEGEGVLTVDGEPFRRGRLAPGEHVLRLDRDPSLVGSPARLVLDVPSPEKRLAPGPLFLNFD